MPFRLKLPRWLKARSRGEERHRTTDGDRKVLETEGGKRKDEERGRIKGNGAGNGIKNRRNRRETREETDQGLDEGRGKGRQEGWGHTWDLECTKETGQTF